MRVMRMDSGEMDGSEQVTIKWFENKIYVISYAAIGYTLSIVHNKRQCD